MKKRVGVMLILAVVFTLCFSGCGSPAVSYNIESYLDPDSVERLESFVGSADLHRREIGILELKYSMVSKEFDLANKTPEGLLSYGTYKMELGKLREEISYHQMGLTNAEGEIRKLVTSRNIWFAVGEQYYLCRWERAIHYGIIGFIDKSDILILPSVYGDRLPRVRDRYSFAFQNERVEDIVAKMQGEKEG